MTRTTTRTIRSFPQREQLQFAHRRFSPLRLVVARALLTRAQFREVLSRKILRHLLSLSGGWCYFCPLSDFRSDIVSLYELKMARKMGE